MRSIQTALVLAVGFGIASVNSAQAAYIDPNTGGLIFQLLAVVFTLASSLILFFSSRIRLMMARFRRTTNGEESRGSDFPADDTVQ